MRDKARRLAARLPNNCKCRCDSASGTDASDAPLSPRAAELVETDRCRDDRNRNQTPRRSVAQATSRRPANSKAAAVQRLPTRFQRAGRAVRSQRPSTTATSVGKMRPPHSATRSPAPGITAKSAPIKPIKKRSSWKQDLAELVAGSARQVPTAANNDGRMAARSADRPPLMQRLNTAHQDRLKKWLANEDEFAAPPRRCEARSPVRRGDCGCNHARDGFEYADDDDYAGLRPELQQSGQRGRRAANANLAQHEQARCESARNEIMCRLPRRISRVMMA